MGAHQNQREILDCIQLVLQSEGLNVGTVRRTASARCGFVWTLSGTDSCLVALRRVLPHLVEKRRQAELVLTMKSGDVTEVRNILSMMKGNQNRFKHLDLAGCQLAHDIVKVR